MFQKELADRICAEPGTRDFSRLTVMVQQSCHAKILYNVGMLPLAEVFCTLLSPRLLSGSKNFVPAPDVDAAMVYLEPRVEPVMDVDIRALEQLCRLAFNMKRKVPSATVHHQLNSLSLSRLCIVYWKCDSKRSQRCQDFIRTRRHRPNSAARRDLREGMVSLSEHLSPLQVLRRAAVKVLRSSFP